MTEFSQVGAEDAVDPLTADFGLSRGDLKHRLPLTIETSSSDPTFPSLTLSPDCGFGIVGSCTHAFSWNGRVKIKRAR